jgi:hypothetical protein
VKAAGLEDRIELRQQNIVEVHDVDRFDCVWLPSLFFGREILEQALPRIFAATRLGGRVVLAYVEPPDDPLSRASSRLRTIRDGGAVLDRESAAALLRETGGANVHALPRTVPIPVSFLVAERG